ncbi:hypothetical protein Lupro_01490 [Lutibacter profundi]|uniref:Cytochrome oxidase subunit I profile domain-containing protein n=1 Tax=Lutibacter profundi TaxID=1622118 RepID=A0A0X8G4Q3_9FLAO|nr:hypothetical protein [Lutibacter profundi]AMC10009.1 hypothetical protein Lupro_01490 [Lutibacter profundi]
MLFKKDSKLLSLLALSLFMLSAIYGLLLRWNFTFSLPFVNYHHFLQSHSHVAFLGWGYLATIGVLLSNFVAVNAKQKKIYKTVILIIVVAISLMLISFPLGGYKLFSIVLLSVFGLASYVLSYRLLKDIKGNSVAVKLIKYGIYYYILSSLATWFLAGVVVTQGKTDLYHNTIYFYLHFLYNGYFVFVLFGFLFKIFEKQKITISKKLQENFFIYLNVACIPAYALSILWSGVSSVYYIIGFAASILQLFSLFFLIKIVRQAIPQLKWNSISKLLLNFALIAYSLKICIQIASAFPYIVKKSLALKPFFIIGYLHLFTLAFMSVLLFLILDKLKIVMLKNNISKIGIIIFLIGVFTTEVILFLQGYLLFKGLSPIVNYNLLLLIFSAAMVIGLLMLFVNRFRNQE